LLARAREAYVGKLWGGNCFRFDMSPRGERVIMADQLAGYWYRSLAGRRGLLARDQVHRRIFL
jgi:uncharacterized protein (DUF608 family)